MRCAAAASVDVPRDALRHRVVLDRLRRVDLLDALRRMVRVLAHDAHEALEVFTLGVRVHGDRRPRVTLARGKALLGHPRRDRPIHVGGDDIEAVRFRELDRAAIVLRVVGPRAAAREKELLVDRAGEVEVEAPLRVALEHLHRDRHLAAPLHERLGELELQPVGRV